jgi:hypothetical protein
MKSLDDVRARYPHVGLALYAYEPGKPVTLECIGADGKTFKFTGRTEADAISKAFDEDDAPSVAPTPSPAPAERGLHTYDQTTPPPTSVFD